MVGTMPNSRWRNGVLSDFLTASGYEVVVAKNGDLGVKMFRAENPDLIVLDIVMPVKSGFDVIKNIGVETKKKKILIIVLSNLEQRQDMKTALNLGATYYLLKATTSLTELGAKIAKLLR